MPRVVALLRGINVGGNKKVLMADLKKAIEGLGFADVKTLLNTGNVIFEAPKMADAELIAALEGAFKKAFGFEIPTIVRPAAAIEALAKADPFKGVKVDENTRLYITFLGEKPESKTPPKPDDPCFRILKVTDGEVVSVLQLDPKNRTPEAMAILEKTYGKKVTTRNWNTVLKLLA
jgi:uncharacterized protein (DUF1697 family)